MTRARELLGSEFDDPPAMPADARHNFPKREVVQATIERLKGSTDSEAIDIVWWEMALLRFSPIPNEGRGQYEGIPFEKFAADFGLTDATAEYAAARAAETDDIVLRIHYLAYALDRMPQTGRAWIDRQRELLTLWRRYVDECRAAVGADAEGHAGLFVENALTAIAVLITRPGILLAGEAEDWVAWLLQLTDDVQTFPHPDAQQESAFWRHRWVAPYLRALTALPSSAADTDARARAIALLDEAEGYYAGQPLTDTFAHLVAEVRYELRSHWGDKNAHRDKIRAQVDALLRRAELHKATGNGMLTQHFYREALRLCETHRQYFTDEDVDAMMREERAAIQHAVDAGEFKVISASVEIPRKQVERVRGTAEDTVDALLREVALAIPSQASLEDTVRRVSEDAPLQRLFPTTVVSGGKVVGESVAEEKNVALEVERTALFQATLGGQAIAVTIVAASSAVGLTAEHLMAPLAPLALDPGATALIRHGCNQIISQDFISACHVLVPRVEDALRHHLRACGLHATEFRRDVGDGTSRTDDEPLGSLLARSLPDSTTVRAHLGEDFVRHIEWTMSSQTGLNLRHSFAHGLARPQHCTPENAGIVLGILYKLADVARANSPATSA